MYNTHTNIANAVTKFTISALCALYTPDIYKFIIAIPKKYIHYFAQLRVTKK